MKKGQDKPPHAFVIAAGQGDQSRLDHVANLLRVQAIEVHRANGEMAYHVLDLMQSFEEASTSGQHIEIRSRCERPAALEELSDF